MQAGYVQSNMQPDPYQTRLKVVFLLIFMLYALLTFGQNYRVRAVRDVFYVPDSARSGQPFRIWSPYLTDSTMLFSIFNQSYRFCVLTSPNQECTLDMAPGIYGWEMIYRYNSSEWIRRDGFISIR